MVEGPSQSVHLRSWNLLLLDTSERVRSCNLSPMGTLFSTVVVQTLAPAPWSGSRDFTATKEGVCAWYVSDCPLMTTGKWIAAKLNATAVIMIHTHVPMVTYPMF